jgi:hypothetical protein
MRRETHDTRPTELKTGQRNPVLDGPVADRSAKAASRFLAVITPVADMPAGSRIDAAASRWSM